MSVTNRRRSLQRRLYTLSERAKEAARHAEACGIDAVHVRDIRQSVLFFRQAIREIDALIVKTRKPNGAKSTGWGFLR